VALLALFIAQAIVGAVTTNEAGATPLYIADVPCSEPEALWLQAQAVPSASLVPCVRSLPTGWRLRMVTVNDGRSVLTFDNDRYGLGAMVLRFGAACDVGGATQVLSDQPGSRRLMLIERLAPRFSATRFDVFAGGCVTTRLTTPAAHRAELTSELPLLLGFTTRQTLQQTLEQRSDGRLHLDPRPA
jgi:hypothetical protein